MLHAVYKDHAPSMTTIRYWFNVFKRGRTSVFEEERPGRPIELTTEDMVKKIHYIVLADRRVKIREIADIVDISTERMQNIRKIVHERSIGDMGAVFDHSGAKTASHDNFIRKSFYGVSWLLTKHGSITTR